MFDIKNKKSWFRFEKQLGQISWFQDISGQLEGLIITDTAVVKDNVLPAAAAAYSMAEAGRGVVQVAEHRPVGSGQCTRVHHHNHPLDTKERSLQLPEE